MEQLPKTIYNYLQLPTNGATLMALRITDGLSAAGIFLKANIKSLMR